MRVAVDTNALYTNPAGVARYVRGLLGGLRTLAEPGLELIEFAWKVDNSNYVQPSRALRTFYRELVWAHLIAPGRLRRVGADLLHATATLMVPPPDFLKNIVTIHDLAFIERPERFRRWHRWSWRQRLKRLPRVDRVLCVSRFTAEKVLRLYPRVASKLEVVYQGCAFHPEDGLPPEQPPPVALPPEYFLFVGSLEPGKNLGLLNAVYRLAAHQGKRLPPLIIVGARWGGVATEGTPPPDWQYLGRQPDEVLVYLYRRALALVFPSKYEGFGLPVVEAMALGCPVICSPVASLPEVGGDAVLFAQAEPPAYLRTMAEVESNPRLRAELAERGRQQARKFSYRRCAAETFRVYRELLGG